MSLADLAYCEVADIAAVEGLDDDLALEIQKRARNALLDQALQKSSEDGDESSVPLLDLPNMSREIAAQLAERDMLSVEGLADAAAGDLEGIEGLDSDQANALIIAAREASGWFE